MSFESQHKTVTNIWEGLSCPHCKALFKVDKKDLSLTKHSSFSCLSCNEIFWAGLDVNNKIETLTHSPKIQNEEKVIDDYKICPHCYQSLKKGVVDCTNCGKSFYDSEWRKGAPYASFQLRKFYEDLMQNYDSTGHHDKFISKCLKENNISFGLYCYGRLRKKRPQDEEATRRFKNLQDVVHSFMLKNQPAEKSHRSYTTGWVHALLFFAVTFSLLSLFILYTLVR